MVWPLERSGRRLRITTLITVVGGTDPPRGSRASRHQFDFGIGVRVPNEPLLTVLGCLGGVGLGRRHGVSGCWVLASTEGADRGHVDER